MNDLDQRDLPPKRFDAQRRRGWLRPVSVGWVVPGWVVLSWVVLGFAVSGCGGGSDSDGVLLLGTSADVDGGRYRLSGAVFQVMGDAETVPLQTPDPPTGLPLQRELPSGDYVVELQAGWVVGQEADGAFAAVDTATLTSENPQTLRVVAGQVLRAGFVFDVGGVSVDFTARPGETDQPSDD